MTEFCATCKHHLTLTKWAYAQAGVQKEPMDGFVCNAFSGEGDAIWMVGLDPEKEQCEMWTEKERDDG